MNAFLNDAYAAYMHLCWFISMAVGTLYPPLMKYDIFIPVLLFTLPFIAHAGTPTRARKQRLALLPLFWVASGLWAGLFRYREGMYWPHYIVNIPDYCFIGFIFYALVLMFAHRHYRAPTIIFVLLNAWFAVTITFIANMSISGQWL